MTKENILIGIFKNNLFFNSLLLLPYIVVLRIHSFLVPITYQVNETDTLLSKWLFGVIESGFSQSVVATLLVYIHVLYINRLVIQHRLANQITLLPGLIYALLVSFLPEYAMLSPYLIANTFVIIGISQIFKTYKKPQAADILFNIGLYIAISSLFVPNYIWIILVGFIGLFVLRSLKTAEILQLLSGSILTYIVFCSVLFLNDTPMLPELSKISLMPQLTIFHARGAELYKLLGILVLSLFAILNYGSYTLKKSIQVQKKIDILFWFMIAALLIILLCVSLNANQALLLFIPLAIMLNFNFVNLKNVLLQEVLHVCLLGLLFALNFGWI